MNKHYLYKITNRDTGEEYVGVTNDPIKRWKDHADAESKVGRSIQKHGIEYFNFETIGTFVNRENAVAAEKAWIKQESPELNVRHRPSIVTPEQLPLFDRPSINQPRARKHSTYLKIDQEKLKHNEYFELLRQEGDNIVVFVKNTRTIKNISTKFNARDLVVLAPLGWWNALLGASQSDALTAKRIIPIASEMIQLAQQLGIAKGATVDSIQRIVAKYYNLKVTELLSKSRARYIVRPRQMAMYFAHKYTGQSLPGIGRQFGWRDHTTVLHAWRKITELLQTDAKIKEEHRELQRLIGCDG